VRQGKFKDEWRADVQSRIGGGMDSLLTVKEIAEKLQLKANWIYLHADELGAYRLGKYLRFSWARVIECLERRGSSLGQPHNDVSQIHGTARFKIDQEQIANKSLE
jgi:hypothetical protein